MAGQQSNNAGTVIPLICLQHGHLQCLLGLLCSSSPAPLPAAALRLCSPALLPHPGVRILLFPRLERGRLCRALLPDQRAALMAAIICSTLFLFLFLGLYKTFVSVSFFKKNSLQTSSPDHLLDIAATTRPFPWHINSGAAWVGDWFRSQH